MVSKLLALLLYNMADLAQHILFQTTLPHDAFDQLHQSATMIVGEINYGLSMLTLCCSYLTNFQCSYYNEV